jgi:carboxypeptidase PM20D1
VSISFKNLAFCRFILLGFVFFHGAFAALGQSPTVLLQQLIRFPSISGQEGFVGKFLSAECEARGLNVTRFTQIDSSYNFAASLYPLSERRPNIILLNHLDVVQADDTADWLQPPYSGNLVDSVIWGRGALDAKGLAVMQLEALVKLHATAEKGPFNVTMLCVSGEETGGQNGAARIVNEFFRQLNPILVLGEGGAALPGVVPRHPSKNLYAISIAEKANIWLKLDITQRGLGHGATAPRNHANRALLRALNNLSDVQSPIKFNKTTRRMFRTFGKEVGGVTGYLLKHVNWWIFRPFLRKYIRREPLLASLLTNTATLTHLSNPPGPVNQIPSQATALLDCRLLPGTSRRRFLREVRYGLFEPRFTITVLSENPESEETSPDNLFYKLMERSIKVRDPKAVTIPILFPASTDNNYFRSKGVAVFGITPILTTTKELESIHANNERIHVRELHRGIDFYVDFLRLAQKEGFEKVEIKQ